MQNHDLPIKSSRMFRSHASSNVATLRSWVIWRTAWRPEWDHNRCPRCPRLQGLPPDLSFKPVTRRDRSQEYFAGTCHRSTKNQPAQAAQVSGLKPQMFDSKIPLAYGQYSYIWWLILWRIHVPSWTIAKKCESQQWKSWLSKKKQTTVIQ
jgi:hypothetical protein